MGDPSPDQSAPLSFLAFACTTVRAAATLVQVTVGNQMFEVPCTRDLGAAEPFRKGMPSRKRRALHWPSPLRVLECCRFRPYDSVGPHGMVDVEEVRA